MGQSTQQGTGRDARVRRTTRTVPPGRTARAQGGAGILLAGVLVLAGVAGPTTSASADDAVVVAAGASGAVDSAGVGVGTIVPVEAATPTETSKVVTPLKSGAYRLSSYYGARCIPAVGASAWHLGQDLAAADGTDITSVTDGVVRTAGAVSGFGQWIVVDSVVKGQQVSFVYGHMWNGTKYVKAGQKVKAGQHIADVGANGIATGPHLHLEVWLGGYGKTSTDPLAYLKAHGVNVAAGATSALTRSVPASCTYYASTRVNLRTGTSTSTPSKKVLPVNAVLRSTPGAKSGRWVKVTYGSLSGWVYDSYVSPTKVKVSSPPVVRYVAVTTLHLRASASTSAKIVANLSRGTAVTYAGSVSSSGWVKVKAGSHTGYVATEYLATSKVKALYPVRYVDVTTLNLRAKASTSSKVVAKLHEGAAVQPLGKTSSSGWLQVSASGHTGYVSAQYLRSKK